MKKAKRKRPQVVDGLAVRVSPTDSAPVRRSQPAPAAEQNVRRSRSCPLCRERQATTEVTVGAVNVLVCSPCADPILDGISVIGAASRLLARLF